MSACEGAAPPLSASQLGSDLYPISLGFSASNASTPFGGAEHQVLGDPEDVSRGGGLGCQPLRPQHSCAPPPRRAAPQVLHQVRFGVAEDCGGRPYHDDTHALFSLRLPDGRRFTVAAVLDGHHQHHVAQLARDHLPYVMLLALQEHSDVSEALVRC